MVVRVAPFLLTCLVLATSARETSAQLSLAVSATLPIPAPTGSGVRNLDFGTISIVSGSTQTVDVPAAVNPQASGAVSGEFALSPVGAAGYQFQVGMPTQLTMGGAVPPLTFSANGPLYAATCWVDGTNTCATTWTTFNPVTQPTQLLCRRISGNHCQKGVVFGPGSAAYIYVGGNLSVPPTAAAGIYSATITMTILQVY